uniref:Uncharacterized protein n=1 Tax=Ditylenchus dipsaci TaxID=166011 RepID=A0A915DKF3_9BILA
MRHTKKMVVVPEEEYLTLLSMLKNGHNSGLELEKAKVENEMSKTLRGNKDADLKAKRYDWLYKQKRELAKTIDETPQKVVIQNAGEFAGSTPIHMSAAPPYLDIGNKTNVSLNDNEENMPSEESEKHNLSSVTSTDQRSFEDRKINLDDSDEYVLPYINASYAQSLRDYILANKSSFGISSKKTIRASSFGRHIAGSNYESIVEYMSNPLLRSKKEPPGFRVLFEKLRKDPFYIEIQINQDKKATG